jgi:hypothetical protein
MSFDTQLISELFVIIVPFAIAGLLAALWFVFRKGLATWVYEPIYAKIASMEELVLSKIDAQFINLKEDMVSLRKNGHVFADRVSNIEERQTQGARESESIRTRLRNLEHKE